MDDTDVSVIVPTYDTGGLMPTSLAHLEVQSHPAARFEVFIADHGNSDESAALIERYHERREDTADRALSGHGCGVLRQDENDTMDGSCSLHRQL